jgi:ABC-2 type transport system permease protein
MSLMQLGIFSTAPALVALREQQVLRRLGATPLPRATLLAAQVAYRLTVAAVQAFVLLAVGSFAFGVNILGSPALLAGLILLGALLFVSAGYLVAGLANTQDSANGLAQVISFAMLMLSGLFFPLEILPAWVRPVARLLPLTYLADALRQVMVGGTPLFPLATDALVLAGWLAAVCVLAIRYFRWE